MSPLDPQRLFDFLQNDPVHQRQLLAKEVMALISDDDWEKYIYSVVDAARFEVREILPKLLTDELVKDVRQIIRRAFIEAASELKAQMDYDPADWWKDDDDDYEPCDEEEL